MIPAWRASKQLSPEFNKEFSSKFEVDVFFTEPKVMISEQEQIDISKSRLDAGFSTLKMELEAVWPQLNEEQIAELELEIQAEKSNKMAQVVGEIDGGELEPDVQDQPS
jgi:hypothetical protein